MRLHRSLAAFEPAPGRRVLTIGAFDGLHRGHQEILNQAGRTAKAERAPLAVMTFEPTPAEYFARAEPPARLTCFRERFELLERRCIDDLVCLRFGDVNSLEHGRFVEDVLYGRLGVCAVVVGHDFRYGAGAQGDVAALRAAGRTLGFGVRVVEPVFLDDERISSTRIRAALRAGDLDLARRMLGRDYSMSGRVVHGLGLGRELGFPTANVNLKRRRAPVDGIFAVEVDGLSGGALAGVASVGNRPTVGGGETLLEVFIFGFDRQVYGEYITVRFRHRLRSERRFETIDAMKAQMHLDVAAAKAALA